MIVSSRRACGTVFGAGMVLRILIDDPRQTSFVRDRHLLNRRSNLNVSFTGKESSKSDTDFTARAKNAGDLYSSASRNPTTWLLDSRTIFSYRTGSIQALTSFETKQYAYAALRQKLSSSPDTEWRTDASRISRTISRGNLEKSGEIGRKTMIEPATVSPSCSTLIEDVATEVFVMDIMMVVCGQR